MYVNKHDHDRSLMIEEQLIARSISDIRVLRAMSKVPREAFVQPEHHETAYIDSALPLPKGQSTSQPYVVAYMTQMLRIKPEDSVLEIGTGSGYQTAVLAELAQTVYSLEIQEELQQSAKKALKKLGYENIHFHLGSGRKGWPEDILFNKIIITAAADKIPPALIQQLAKNGKLVLPLKFPTGQKLILVKKDDQGVVTQENLLDVTFVPLK